MRMYQPILQDKILEVERRGVPSRKHTTGTTLSNIGSNVALAKRFFAKVHFHHKELTLHKDQASFPLTDMISIQQSSLRC